MIALIKSASERTLLISNQNLKISNRNLVPLVTIKGIRENFPLANNVAILFVSKGVHTQIIDTKTVDSKMVNNHHPSIQTWAKLLPRARTINPNAIHHRKRDPSWPLLRITIADVTFVTIQITWPMLVHKSTRISNMLKAS